MKKTYVTPSVDKIAFQYRDQVVAASIPCMEQKVNQGEGTCTNWTEHDYLK